jgi:hypothetical protein
MKFNQVIGLDKALLHKYFNIMIKKYFFMKIIHVDDRAFFIKGRCGKDFTLLHDGVSCDFVESIILACYQLQ